jgi:DNA invertase Pin-like site-specific DNA recombinase
MNEKKPSANAVNAEISARTRQALSEARARGVKLGTAGAANIRATVEMY